MEINTSNLEKNREQWASIDGYRNYEISWWGRVRNIDTNRILKPGTCTAGYLKVTLSKKRTKENAQNSQTCCERGGGGNPDCKSCVDNIDNGRTNSNHENLRAATQSDNMKNRIKCPNASSIYKVVSVEKKTGRWRANIRLKGIKKFLGIFTSEREAGEAYNTAAREHFKQNARLNEFKD